MPSIIAKYKDNPLLVNYSKIFSVDFLVRASNFILLPVYLSIMSQEEFGLYSYIFAIISTFSLVLNFGLYIPQSKLYQDTEDKKNRGILIYSINVILALSLFFTLSITYFTGFDYLIIKLLFKNYVNYRAYRIYILIAIIMTIYSYMLINYFLTSQKLVYVQVYNLLRVFIVNSIVILALYHFGSDKVETRLQFNYMTEFFLLLLFGYFYVKSMKFEFDKKIAFHSIKLAFPIMISAFLGIFLNFSDRFFLEKYGDYRQLAVYNLGITISSIIPIIFASFQNIWLPFFFKEKNVYQNKEKTKKIIIKLALFFLVLAVFIFVGVYFTFILGIIRDEYKSILTVLPLILITQICIAITPLFSNYIVYFERTHIALYTGIPLVFVSIGVNLTLIPIYGIFGAAIASLIINLAYMIMYYVISKNLIKTNLYKNT